VSVGVTNTTPKLNFKEMVMKSQNGGGGSVSTEVKSSGGLLTPATTGGVISNKSSPVPVPVTRQPLSSGNIFLGAFYDISSSGGGGGGGEGGGGDGDGDDGEGGSSGGGFSSTLVDLCDRKYDSLYK
jgi:hypothetical protein